MYIDIIYPIIQGGPPPKKKKKKKTDSECGPNLTKFTDIMRFSRRKFIPKYLDFVEWYLIGSHFSKQWSDHNYEFVLHGTGNEQRSLV